MYLHRSSLRLTEWGHEHNGAEYGDDSRQITSDTEFASTGAQSRNRTPVADFASSSDSSSGNEADDDGKDAEDSQTRPQTAHSARQHKIHQQCHDDETGLLRQALRIHVRNQAPPATRRCHSCSKSIAPDCKVLRCHSCGPTILWCHKCCLDNHPVASVYCTGIGFDSLGKLGRGRTQIYEMCTGTTHVPPRAHLQAISLSDVHIVYMDDSTIFVYAHATRVHTHTHFIIGLFLCVFICNVIK